jgi:translocator protein
MKTNYLLIPLVTIFVALLGSFLTELGLQSWYKTLKLPKFIPSGKIIGMIWSMIFALAAIAALIVYNSSAVLPEDLQLLTYLFAINALMNIFWSLLFFYLHMVGFAVIESTALALSVASLILFIYPISLVAAILLVPYFLWVGFATYLTYSVWRLNHE